MNDKSFIKDPKMLKRDMAQLLSFEEKVDLFKSPKRAERKDLEEMELLSKYARVLSCSFFDRTKETTSEELTKAW